MAKVVVVAAVVVGGGGGVVVLAVVVGGVAAVGGCGGFTPSKLLFTSPKGNVQLVQKEGWMPRSIIPKPYSSVVIGLTII